MGTSLMRRLLGLLVLGTVCTAQAEIKKGLQTHVIVLTYHDVIESRDAKALWFDCTTNELEDQLNWMQKQGVHFISLDQLNAYLMKGSALPSKPVAITFADNYQGFWDRAYPVLRARRVPVAMFVHTGYVGDKAHGRPKMDWDELRTLDREGLVTIGSQTVTHPADIGRLSLQSQKDELSKSKAELEHRLGHRVPYLAYPNGKFSNTSMRLAAEAGYTMAFSEVTRPADLSPSIFAVNRYVHTKYRRAVKALGNERSLKVKR